MQAKSCCFIYKQKKSLKKSEVVLKNLINWSFLLGKYYHHLRRELS